MNLERLQEIKARLEGDDLSTDDLLRWAPELVTEVERLRAALNQIATEEHGRGYDPIFAAVDFAKSVLGP